MSNPNTPSDSDAIARSVAKLSDIGDLTERSIAAGDLLAVLNDAALEAKTVRYLAMKELNDSGVSYTRLSETIGISKTRVQQILTQAPPTKRMGQFEVTARQEAARLRSEGKSDAEIVEEVIPALIQIRSAERFTAAQVAEMLDVATSTAQPKWNSAKRAKERDLASRRK